ncbi:helix-turn-helix domain-containing protein [Cryptosporangium aurantiacum]|uniref:Transcriptional regulator, AraC family n=1 Tax=Cryptosporangium aurantiacum TaxID=134849 RepID=A0A1M7M7E1_9ACTN|nr:helix-turn-helix domain-containing protein [Cryptosporangium aurantiacum]SHM86599.1 transcriptional regulator, AraC family [Cryptosporangium aurantiacum]
MDTRGLRGGWADFQRHWYGQPSADLAPFVQHYWVVHWDLRGQEPFRQLLPPGVNVHLSFVDDQPGTVRGPMRSFSHRTLEGAGRVLGVAFRPGCFRPFLGHPVSDLVDRAVPARSVFGRDLSLTDETALVDAVESFLRADLPPVDPAADSAADAVALIAAEPAVTRVDQLADRLGVGVRQLQRLFVEYVGVGPKWCIRRYRIAEVTARLAAGAVVDWASLAAELGYADQAHFSRDFTAILGEPPTRYALRYP